MDKFEIFITDMPDRENLVVEIWYCKVLIAEINQETEELKIEFYTSSNVEFNLEEFMSILKSAKDMLIKN